MGEINEEGVADDGVDGAAVAEDRVTDGSNILGEEGRNLGGALVFDELAEISDPTGQKHSAPELAARLDAPLGLFLEDAVDDIAGDVA